MQNKKIKKLIFSIQDLKTKDGEVVAVVSGDIHLDTKEKKNIISFQMLLGDNKEFNKVINDLIKQALALYNKK